MSMSQTDFNQSMVEIFCAMICFISAVVFGMIIGVKRKSARDIVLILLTHSVALLADAGWYVIDGRLETICYIFNPILNFLNFICNPMEVILSTKYVCDHIEENGCEKNKVLPRIVYGLAATQCFLTVLNVFVPILFDFDSFNVYYRNPGWYAYTVLVFLGVVALLVFVIASRRRIKPKFFVAMIVYVAMPIVGMLLQALFFGYAFSTSFISFSLILIMIIYLHNWARDEAGEENKKKRDSVLFGLPLFLIMFLFMGISIFFSLMRVREMAKDNSENDSQIITTMVSERIDNIYFRPIVLADMLSKDVEVVSQLQTDSDDYTSTFHELKTIYNAASMDSSCGRVYLVDENTKRYYLYNPDMGERVTTLDENGEFWYNSFLALDKNHTLHFENDPETGEIALIFVSARIVDDQGNLLGACGIEISNDYFVNMLDEYEKSYNINIIFVSEDGAVVTDTEMSHVIGDVVKPEELEQYKQEDISYVRKDGCAIVIKYMDNLDWYLVVVDNVPDKINVANIIITALLIFSIGLILMIIVIRVFTTRADTLSKEVFTNKKAAETDGLTGINNRLAYEEYIASLDEEDLQRISITMMDLNGLKTINDTYGHNVGDEVIVGAAQCMKEAFSDYGRIYRTGGDEFALLSLRDKNEVLKAVGGLQTYIKAWNEKNENRLSVSVGVAFASELDHMDFNDLEDMADRRMYSNKSQYYVANGIERRRR